KVSGRRLEEPNRAVPKVGGVEFADAPPNDLVHRMLERERVRHLSGKQTEAAAFALLHNISCRAVIVERLECLLLTRRKLLRFLVTLGHVDRENFPSVTGTRVEPLHRNGARLVIATQNRVDR